MRASSPATAAAESVPDAADRPLAPLSAFFSGDALRQLHEEAIDGAAMPQPYRRLLVHDSDMTSTLERYHGERLTLRVLARRQRGEVLIREVVLCGETSGTAVEFGAIRIDLARFPPPARQQILACRRPLGAVLAAFDIAYLSRPMRFLRLRANDEVARALALERGEGDPLYGRQNELLTPAGRRLAEVVEVLPPLPAEPR